MPEFIPRSEQRPIVDTSSTTLDLIYFDLVTLASNEQDIRRLPAHESLYVVLSGQVDIEVDDIMFEAVGRRADIWEAMRTRFTRPSAPMSGYRLVARRRKSPSPAASATRATPRFASLRMRSTRSMSVRRTPTAKGGSFTCSANGRTGAAATCW